MSYLLDKKEGHVKKQCLFPGEDGVVDCTSEVQQVKENTVSQKSSRHNSVIDFFVCLDNVSHSVQKNIDNPENGILPAQSRLFQDLQL